MNETPTNPNDYKVVSFHNSEEFGFTPSMGCMYNGIGINGKNGSPGIDAGETITLPYHIAQQLALNLAKYTMNRAASGAPQLDVNGQPIIKAIWNDVELLRMKNSYLTELYSEERQAPMSQTDIMMAKFEEYKKLTDDRIAELSGKPVTQETPVIVEQTPVVTAATYQDKAEILAELVKRGIKHDKRSNKETLEKLLV